MPTPTQADWIAHRAANFVGREWVFRAIDRWLADADGPHYFVITGEPGVGKTTLAARLVQIRDCRVGPLLRGRPGGHP
jgi:hypothetical protein